MALGKMQLGNIITLPAARQQGTLEESATDLGNRKSDDRPWLHYSFNKYF